MSLVRALVILIASLLLAGSASAQSNDWRVNGYLGFEAQGETDLDRSALGDFQFWMPNFGIGATKRLSDSLSVSLKSDYRVIGYDFDLAGGVEPWETVHVARFNPTLEIRLAERWSLISGPIFEISAESSADFEDSLRGGGSVAIGYQGDDFKVAVGILARSEIEDDVYLLPILVVDWGIVDDLRLNGDFSTSRGGDMRLGYTFLDDWTASIAFGYRRERFRLNDDGPLIGEDGVGQEEAAIFKTLLGYRFNDHYRIEAYIGTTIDGDFRWETDTGKKIADSDYDDAVFGGVQFSFGF